MNSNNISNNDINKTKIFTATFDRYISTGSHEVKLLFTNVIDERENLLKNECIIDTSKAMSLIGNLIYGQRVSFIAEFDKNVNYQDGFNFINIKFIGFN